MGMAGEVDQSNYSFKVEGLHLATGGHMGGIKGFYEFTLEGTLGAAAGWLAGLPAGCCLWYRKM